ncbi:hypothetical protein GCM10020254_42010 [Streptomyces goshikiensis]
MEHLNEYLMTQKITPLVNRYTVTTPDGGQVLAFAEQKRLALKEELTLWSGEDRTRRLGGVQGPAGHRLRGHVRRQPARRGDDRHVPQGRQGVPHTLHLAPDAGGTRPPRSARNGGSGSPSRGAGGSCSTSSSP